MGIRAPGQGGSGCTWVRRHGASRRGSTRGWGPRGSTPAGVSCADVLEARVGVRFQSMVPGWDSLSLVVRGLGLACSVASFSGAPSSRRLRRRTLVPTNQEFAEPVFRGGVDDTLELRGEDGLRLWAEEHGAGAVEVDLLSPDGNHRVVWKVFNTRRFPIVLGKGAPPSTEFRETRIEDLSTRGHAATTALPATAGDLRAVGQHL